MAGKCSPLPLDRVFGRLTFIEEVEGSRPRRIRCRCSCGKITTPRLSGLKDGTTKSCGCLQKDVAFRISALAHKALTKHGMAHTRFYSMWTAIRHRCEKVGSKDYKFYGARGIRVCERWATFENFRDDMLDKYNHHCEQHGVKLTTIDRIDSTGPYSPENCRFGTYVVQGRNKSTNHVVEWQGKRQILTEWSEELGIPRNVLYHRFGAGWSVERAFTQPIRTSRRRKDNDILNE